MCSIVLRGKLPTDSNSGQESLKPDASLEPQQEQPSEPAQERTPDSSPDQGNPNTPCSERHFFLSANRENNPVVASHGLKSGEWKPEKQGEHFFSLKATDSITCNSNKVLILSPKLEQGENGSFASTYHCNNKNYSIRLFRNTDSGQRSQKISFTATVPTTGFTGIVEQKQSDPNSWELKDKTIKFFGHLENGKFEFRFDDDTCKSEHSPIFVTIYNQNSPGYAIAGSLGNGTCVVQTFNKDLQPSPQPFAIWIPESKKGKWATVNKTGSVEQSFQCDKPEEWKVERSDKGSFTLRIPNVPEDHAFVVGARLHKDEKTQLKPANALSFFGVISDNALLKVQTFGKNTTGSNNKWSFEDRDFFVLLLK